MANEAVYLESFFGYLTKLVFKKLILGRMEDIYMSNVFDHVTFVVFLLCIGLISLVELGEIQLESVKHA